MLAITLRYVDGCVPPKLYGGTERVISRLTEELVSLGHDVTLFASGDSRTRADLVPVWPRGLRLGRPKTDPAIPQAALLEAIAERAPDFDVIHCTAPHLAATAQSVYGTLGIGAAVTVLTFASGVLYQHLGGRGFWVMAALCVAAIPIAMRLQVRE